ncbi:MAG: hypothetical protein GXY23_09180, partial [Myxococcales bacterium]|nr:hypothetical protein [Myxococcales bacterium]
MRRSNSKLFSILAFVAACGIVAPNAAYAVDPPAKHRIVYNANVAARVNPLGLFLFGDVMIAERLFRSRDVLLAQNHFAVGLAPQLSPAFARIGLKAELQPLTIFKVWATYDVGGWFGSFGFLQSFASPNSDWSDSGHDRLEDAGINPQAVMGHNLTLGSQFQFKLGNLAIRNIFRAEQSFWQLDRTRANLDGTVTRQTVYYNSIWDVPIEFDGGWMVTNDLDLFYFFGSTNWIAAIRYNWTRPIYSDAAWANVDPDENHRSNIIHR